MSRFLGLILATALTILVAGQVSALTGGPDAFGYTFIDSTEAGGPAFAFEDISATGTVSDISDDDDAFELDVPLGFSFTFYGTAYTDLNISTNGHVRFATSNVEFENEAIPTQEIDGPAIFPFWDDLNANDLGGCGDIYYQTLGSAPDRRFIVQWDACHFNAPTGDPACAVSVQVILFETTNEILMQYQDTIFSCNAETHDADNGESASVGIQQSPAVGLQYSTHQPVITQGLAICFAPPNGENGICGEAEVFSLTIVKLCPNGAGAGDASFNILVTQLADVIAAEQLACDEDVVLELEPGDYDIQEVITGPIASAFETSIVCGDEETEGLLATVTLLDEDVECEVINTFDAGIDLDNTNDNALNNDNLNTNNNENTNTQEQSNEQVQENDNNQTTGVNSSPSIVIDFDE